MDESSAMEMETSVEQREIGNSIEIPCEIKNDLIYCQKSLSNHVLIHQVSLNDTSLQLFHWLSIKFPPVFVCREISLENYILKLISTFLSIDDDTFRLQTDEKTNRIAKLIESIYNIFFRRHSHHWLTSLEG